MMIHAFCNCKNQQPEEIKRGVYQCKTCLNDVNPADLAQDEDMSTCNDLVQDDQSAYEQDRYISQTEDRSGMWEGLE